MHNNDQVTGELPYIHEQESLTLPWGSFNEWGADYVAISYANKSFQYVRYA